MPTTREKVEAAKRAYDTAGKNKARAVVMGVAVATRPMTILDLWGGGESAKAFRATVPDAAVVSAERDEDLWPLLLQDAQTTGFAYHLGSAEDAPGHYDLIWLDLCAQANKETEAAISGMRAKLTLNGTLFVTILPARETDRVLAGEQRLLQLPLWMESISGMKVKFLMPYRRDNGLPMWLVALRRVQDKSHFHDEALFAKVKATILQSDYWNDGLPISEDAAALLGMRKPYKLGTLLDLDAELADAESQERGIELEARIRETPSDNENACHGCNVDLPVDFDYPPWHADWHALHHPDCLHKGCYLGRCIMVEPGVASYAKLDPVQRNIIDALIKMGKSGRDEELESALGG